MCESISVHEELIKNLFLAPVGRGTISTGCGAFISNLPFGIARGNETVLANGYYAKVGMSVVDSMQKEICLYRQFELYAVLHGVLL